MARYGRDYGPGMERGWGGRYMGGGGARDYGRGWSSRGWNQSDFSDRGWGDRERMRFGPRGDYGGRYDRGFGDDLRAGWNDLKRGFRDAFGGGGYDRGYRGGQGGYGRSGGRGGYAGYGRGYDRGWF